MWPANEFQIAPAQIHFRKETDLCTYNVLTYSYQMQIHLCRQRFIITFLQLAAALLKYSKRASEFYSSSLPNSIMLLKHYFRETSLEDR
jgi:hypothetical protein